MAALKAAVGEIAFAISDYTTAVHLKPDLIEAWYNRGTTFTHSRSYERADLTQAIDDEPTAAIALSRRSQAYEVSVKVTRLWMTSGRSSLIQLSKVPGKALPARSRDGGNRRVNHETADLRADLKGLDQGAP